MNTISFINAITKLGYKSQYVNKTNDVVYVYGGKSLPPDLLVQKSGGSETVLEGVSAISISKNGNAHFESIGVVKGYHSRWSKIQLISKIQKYNYAYLTHERSV